MNTQEMQTNDFDGSLDDPRQALYACTSGALVVIDKKTSLVAEFTTAQQGFITSLNKGMEFAFKMGEILSEIKKITPHGKFEKVLKYDLHGVFGIRHAQKLMRLSEGKELILSISDGVNMTIDRALLLISESRQIKAEPMPVPVVDPAEPVVPDEVVTQPSIGKEGSENIEYAEFIDIALPEVKQGSALPQEPTDYSDDDLAEDMAGDVVVDELANLVARNEYLEGLFIIFEDDDHTASAIKRIGELTAVNAVLESQVNMYLNENAVLKSRLNHLESQRKVHALDLISLTPRHEPPLKQSSLNKYKEEKQAGVESLKNPKTSATRLSKSWKPSLEDISFCSSIRPDLNVNDVADEFRDYWIGVPGAKGKKEDWPATWRNWVRKQFVKQGGSIVKQPLSKQSRMSLTGIDYNEGVNPDGTF